MWGALLSTCFKGVASVLWRKALAICKWNESVSMYVFSFFWMIGSIIITIIYITTGMVEFSDLRIPREIIAIICWAILMKLVYRPMSQRLNQQESLATLVPFSNLNKIFSLTLSFFIFKDVSLTALLISLSAVVVIIWFSIDFKHFKLPNNFRNILIIQTLVSICYIIMSRTILQVSDKVFYIYDSIIYVIMLSIIIIVSHAQGQFKEFNGWFYKNRLWASFIGAAWTVISLYLITQLWATAVLLLWFLQVALELVIAYFYLGEKPSKKDIILTVIVSVLVATWFYFK